jgi:Ca2+-binding RTX toxin-like protein
VGDTFLAKLGADGTLRWILQYGSENLDEAFSVATPGNGSIYLSGATYGNLGGQQNASLAAGRLDADAFITRFSDPEFLDSNKTGTSDQYSSPQSATPTPLTTAAPATAGVDPISESQPSISPPPPAPPSSSSILGIKPQETVKTVGLQTPLVIGSLKIDQAVVGTVARDLITGSDTGEALAGGQGKDKMTGGGGSDAFVFETPGEFGKKKADTITDFRPEEGDKIAIAKETFSEVSRIKLDTATGKQEVRSAASTNKNFIYDDKSGILYFNENGRKAGFGNGGEFAQLLGAPDISKGDLVLL